MFRRIYLTGIICVLMLLVAACGNNSEETPVNSSEPVDIVANDASFTGVLVSVNEADSSITLLNLNYNTEVTVSIKGDTGIYKGDKTLTTLASLSVGMLLDVVYDAETMKGITIEPGADSWCYNNIVNWSYDEQKFIFKIADNNYQYDSKLLIMDEGAISNLMNLNPVDKLKAYGIGKKIYSIVVEKGHGYIRPSSYDDFIGGTIFVGYTLNQPITEDMLVVVPEGTYDVTMRNGELVGSHSIEVKRNQETVFDMSEYKQLPENKGEVIFKVTPVGADLYVNGKLTDFSKPVLLNYGEHSIEVMLTGYNSYSGILDVKSPNPTVVIDLAEEQVDAWDDELLDDDDFDNDDYDSDDSDFDDSDFDDSDFGDLDEQPSVTNKPSESTVTATDNTGVSKSEIVYDKAHTITVSEPAGAEIYLNGEYKGIVPSAFPKQIGTQVVTLSKNGCITKSFTIVIPDDGQDITWKFPNLDKGN